MNLLIPPIVFNSIFILIVLGLFAFFLITISKGKSKKNLNANEEKYFSELQNEWKRKESGAISEGEFEKIKNSLIEKYQINN
ncbi:MAG: hypothetical protein WCI97_03625 [Bacteroidota bacterium]